MNPQRIASLLASGTEILYGLGLGDRVVAVSHECDYPAGVQEKPKVTHTHVDASASSGAIDRQVRTLAAEGSALYGLDLERLADLKPDLIVTQSQCRVCAVSYDDVVQAVRGHDALRDAHVVALNPNTLQDIWLDIMRVAQAAGVSVPGEAMVGGLRRRVRAVGQAMQGLTDQQRPRVVCLDWIDPVMLAGNWMPQLIDLAGGQCLPNQSDSDTDLTDWQRVLAFDPQIIVVMPCGFDLPRSLQQARTLTTLPGWGDLQAAKRRNVYAVDGNAYFNRSGPRIVDSLEILAALAHPDRFNLPAHIPKPPWQRPDLCG